MMQLAAALTGDIIMRDGDDGDCFFIIVNGEVKMSVLDPETDEDVTIGARKNSTYSCVATHGHF
jgi:CRP-like cAMP-binding protein